MLKICMTVFISVILLSCEKKFEFASEKVVSNLVMGAREDITKDQRVKEYLDKHPVYVSLTTSPERLPKILPVLKTIDQDLVKEILLVLPKQFKDKEDYPDPLPAEIVNFPKVKVLRPDKDLGPITKLLPAIEYAKAIDPFAIDVTIDDDTGYPRGLFGQLVKTLILSQNPIVAGSQGGPSSAFNLASKKKLFENRCDANGVCDIVEGYGAIAYLAGSVPVEEMQRLAKKSPKCFLGDDIVINYALADKGIKRQKVSNRYVGMIVQFDFGAGPDALHNQNNYKNSYQECVTAIESDLP